MKRKFLASVLALALCVVSFAACGGGEAEPTETTSAESGGETKSAGGGYSFEIVSKGFQHQYWQAVLQGAEEAAAELGDEINFVGPASESDIADQVQMLTNAVNSGPDAIGLATLDTEASLDVIQSAMDAGIPIVGFDSGVPEAPEGSVFANCATDNYAAGELAATNMFDAIKDRVTKASGTVRIGVLAQDATSESVVNRGLGFIDKMGSLVIAEGKTVKVEGNEKYVKDAKVKVEDKADVVIEVLVPSQITDELSAVDCTNLLNKSDTIAIYGSNEHSGKAMVTANETVQKFGTGDSDIIGVAFDSGEVIKGAVREGIFLGAVTQAPVAMGRALVETLHAICEGETVSDIDTGCQWYNADNMDDPEIAPNLYD